MAPRRKNDCTVLGAGAAIPQTPAPFRGTSRKTSPHRGEEGEAEWKIAISENKGMNGDTFENRMRKKGEEDLPKPQSHI